MRKLKYDYVVGTGGIGSGILFRFQITSLWEGMSPGWQNLWMCGTSVSFTLFFIML